MTTSPAKPYTLKPLKPMFGEGLTKYRMVGTQGSATGVILGTVFREPGYGWTAEPNQGGRAAMGGYRRRVDAVEVLWQDWLADNIARY